MRQNQRKHTKKTAVLTAAALICLLAVAGLSRPGRASVVRLFSLVKGGVLRFTVGAAPPVVAGPDAEQRARGKHGWGTGQLNSVVRGTVTYFHDGLVVRQAGLTVYREYPDRLRVEVAQQGIIDAFGFGNDGEWQLRAASLTEEEKRDVRGWLRLWPERLFVERGASEAYRELGGRAAGPRAAAPGRGQAEALPARLVDEVEVMDEVAPAGDPHQVNDRRALYYEIDREKSVVTLVRWIEPDRPGDNVDDPKAPTREVRVEFSGWRRFAGVLLPTQVTRWVGGQADLTIDVTEVLLNQALPDTLFKNPNP